MCPAVVPFPLVFCECGTMGIDGTCIVCFRRRIQTTCFAILRDDVFFRLDYPLPSPKTHRLLPHDIGDFSTRSKRLQATQRSGNFPVEATRPCPERIGDAPKIMFFRLASWIRRGTPRQQYLLSFHHECGRNAKHFIPPAGPDSNRPKSFSYPYSASNRCLTVRKTRSITKQKT